MGTNQRILIVGLCLAVVIVIFGRINSEHPDPDYQESDYIEFASILWKARVYHSEIEFIADDRVFYTARFGSGETHVQSFSYRSLNGYFDPVFVTVWKRSPSHTSLIIDPLRERTLLQVDSGSEIDVSISPDNKIVITYTDPGQGNEDQTGDKVVTWP